MIKDAEILLEMVKMRHSVRAFLPWEIEPEKAHALNTRIRELNGQANLNMQLTINESQAFGSSFLAKYGKFSNVANYIVMAGPKDSDAEIGYYGEQIVLLAQSLGLNTCWVGLTFKKGKVDCELREGDKIYGLIAIGYGATQGVPHKIKRPDQVADAKDLEVDWFRAGVECALLAPTAMNQQKFHFSLNEDGSVRIKSGWGPYTKLDLDIARLHFELGSKAVLDII